MMNIFALPGHKVKVTEETIKYGHDDDQEIVKKYLEIGKEYEISYTEVYGFHTDVYLREFPEIRFNSANFEDVIPQDDKENEKHPDWIKYYGKFI